MYIVMFVSLAGIIILVVVLTFVWPPDSPWSPWWRTNRKIARQACRLAKLTKSDIVYELGSGDGEFILTAAKEFQVKRAVGIEIDYSRYFISKLKKLIRKVHNAEFVRSDFKKIKMNDATVVYFYLVPAVIRRIMPKLKNELSPGTKIVSYRYRTSLKEEAREEDLYLYRI